jgi:hypothetical protein
MHKAGADRSYRQRAASPTQGEGHKHRASRRIAPNCDEPLLGERVFQVGRNSRTATEKPFYLRNWNPVRPALFAIALIPVEARDPVGHASIYAFVYA